MPAIHPRISRALAEKANGARTTPAEWLRAWHPLAPFCSTSAADELLMLIGQCDSPSDLSSLAEILRSCRTGSSWLANLLDDVDASPATLPLWIQGLALARQWLRDHQSETTPTFQSLSSYLSCCAEYYASQTTTTGFIDTVQHLLDDHGIDAAT